MRVVRLLGGGAVVLVAVSVTATLLIEHVDAPRPIEFPLVLLICGAVGWGASALLSPAPGARSARRAQRVESTPGDGGGRATDELEDPPTGER